MTVLVSWTQLRTVCGVSRGSGYFPTERMGWMMDWEEGEIGGTSVQDKVLLAPFRGASPAPADARSVMCHYRHGIVRFNCIASTQQYIVSAKLKRASCCSYYPDHLIILHSTPRAWAVHRLRLPFTIHRVQGSLNTWFVASLAIFVISYILQSMWIHEW